MDWGYWTAFRNDLVNRPQSYPNPNPNPIQFYNFINKMSEKLCLQWNDFQENVKVAFRNLRGDETFTDLTLAEMVNKWKYTKSF